MRPHPESRENRGPASCSKAPPGCPGNPRIRAMEGAVSRLRVPAKFPTIAKPPTVRVPGNVIRHRNPAGAMYPGLQRIARRLDVSDLQLHNCRKAGTLEFSQLPELGNTRVPSASHRVRGKNSLVALEPAMLAPTHGHAVAAHRAHQEQEPVLLILVEALVERIGRVGEALEARRGLGHGVGALAQPRDRIRRPRRAPLAAPGPPFGPPLIALLGEIADRLLDRRPVPLLVG